MLRSWPPAEGALEDASPLRRRLHADIGDEPVNEISESVGQQVVSNAVGAQDDRAGLLLEREPAPSRDPRGDAERMGFVRELRFPSHGQAPHALTISEHDKAVTHLRDN